MFVIQTNFTVEVIFYFYSFIYLFYFIIYLFLILNGTVISDSKVVVATFLPL